MSNKKFPFQEANYPAPEASKASDASLDIHSTHNASGASYNASEAYALKANKASDLKISESTKASEPTNLKASESINRKIVTAVTTAPQIEQLLDDALSIISTELANYRRKVRNGNLDLKDARAVQGYMESLTKMAREAREARKDNSDKLKGLTDEELIKLLKS